MKTHQLHLKKRFEFCVLIAFAKLTLVELLIIKLMFVHFWIYIHSSIISNVEEIRNCLCGLAFVDLFKFIDSF